MRRDSARQRSLRVQMHKSVAYIYDFCLNYQGHHDLSFVTRALLRVQRIHVLQTTCQEISRGVFPKLLLRLLDQQRIVWRIKKEEKALRRDRFAA